MTAFSKLLPSGSINGKPIICNITTLNSGSLFHTALGTTNGEDEIWMWINNLTTAVHSYSVGFGASTPDCVIYGTVPAGTTQLVIPGWPLNNGLLVTAWTDAASNISMSGYVNRIQ